MYQKLYRYHCITFYAERGQNRRVLFINLIVGSHALAAPVSMPIVVANRLPSNVN